MFALSERVCLRDGCGSTFEPRAQHQIFCSEKCRYRHRDARNPELIRANRARCAEWARAHRGVHRSQPWLLGAPAFGEYLPGGGFLLGVTPAPKWAIELRNTRGLHGMVTALIGEPHDANIPRFTLVPANGGCGWGVVMLNEDRARQLSGRTVHGVLYDRECAISCGPLVKIKSPSVARRGRRRLRIDAVTPVCVRNSSNGTHWTHVLPSSGNMHSTLAAWMPQRVGLELDPGDIRLELVSHDANTKHVPLLGKHGVIVGWEGSCVVETNAVGHWLLKVAESIGLGGRVAYGFGRVRVTECD